MACADSFAWGLEQQDMACADSFAWGQEQQIWHALIVLHGD